MKGKLLISVLALSLFLSACGKKNENKDSNVKIGSSTNKVVVNSNSASNKESEDSKESANTPITSAFDKEFVDNLIENSNYISRVRIQNSSTNGLESNFLTDYVGDLSNVEIELPKSLIPNKEYIIFYKDGDNGKIEPTRGNDSFIEIKDENDSNLIYLNEKFVTTGSN